MDWYTQAQWVTLCASGEPIPFDAHISDWSYNVSLKIEARYDPGVRRELRQRMYGLIRSAQAIVPDEEDKEGEREQRIAMFREELKAFYLAFTDCNPTHDEMQEMLPG